MEQNRVYSVAVGQNRRSIAYIRSTFDREEEINIIFDNISFAIFNLIERWVLINTHSADRKRGLIGGARVFTRGYARTMQNRLGSLVHSRHSVFGAPRTYSFEKDRKRARVQFRRPATRVSGRRNNSAASKSARLHAPSRFNELCCVRIR